MGHNSVKMLAVSQVFISAHCLRMLYILPKFIETYSILLLQSRHTFNTENYKGFTGNSIKQWVELWLFSAHCLMVFYTCTKFHENIFDSFQVIDQAGFLYLNYREA